jgi:hypothetical protein
LEGYLVKARILRPDLFNAVRAVLHSYRVILIFSQHDTTAVIPAPIISFSFPPPSMENDNHANDEFTSNSAGDYPEFVSWVLL